VIQPCPTRYSIPARPICGVHSARSDVAAFVLALRGRIGTRAANALESNTRFIAGEAGAVTQLNTALTEV
jgi:hypothetical protein